MTANTSAMHRTGSSQPAEALASPTASTIMGTTRIPSPGTPVLATPTKKAAKAPSVHCHHARSGISPQTHESPDRRPGLRRMIIAHPISGDVLSLVAAHDLRHLVFQTKLDFLEANFFELLLFT